MNKQEFISLIEQPDQLGKSHITALKQVAADFPYFQAAQVLLTKALYNDHHYEFEKQLKHTSLLVPDRTVLFRYIHNLSDQQQPVPVLVPETVQIAETETTVAPVEHFVSVSVVEELTEEIPTAENLVETTSEIEQPVVTEEIIETTIQEVVTAETFTPVAPPEVIETKEEEPVQEIKSSESHSFTEWLQLQQGKKVIVTETPAESIPKNLFQPNQLLKRRALKLQIKL
ncbi:MAG: hypothetical protein V4651_14665 [Bacteroidota bacterium]